MRTIGPIRATTPPLSSVIGAPFSVGADTGCTNTAFRVTGGIHATTVLGIGLCPPNVTPGNAWINNQLVVGAAMGSATARLQVIGSGTFTTVGWSKAIELANVGVIKWMANAGGKRFFLGQTNGGLYLGRSTADDGTGPPDYVMNWGDAGDVNVMIGPLIVGTDPGTPSGLNGTLRVGGGVRISPRSTSNAFAAGLYTRFFETDQAIGGIGAGDLALTYNAYYSTGWKSLAGGRAAAFGTSGGAEYRWLFSQAAAGADDALTWTEALRLTTAALTPATAGGLTLGTASLPWGVGHFRTTVRLYDDDASPGTERGYLDASVGVLDLISSGAWSLRLGTNSLVRWELTSSGHFLAGADNTYDIGSGSLRPRDAYIARDVFVDGLLKLEMGVSGFYATGRGASHVNTTSTASGAGANVNIVTYSLPANSLDVNGRGLRIRAWGSVAGTTGTKEVRILFGSAIVATSGTVPISTASTWLIEGVVYRTGAATQRIAGVGFERTNTSSPQVVNGTETLSSAVTIAVNALQSSGGDVTVEGFTVEYLSL